MSTRHVHSVLEEVVAGVFVSKRRGYLLADAYMCRPCVRSVEKLTMLRHDRRQQEQELIERIKHAGEVRDLSRTDEAAAHVEHDGEVSSFYCGCMY